MDFRVFVRYDFAVNKKTPSARRLLYENIIKNIAVSRYSSADHLCGGLPVPLRRFFDDPRNTGLRHLCRCSWHDGSAGRVLGGREDCSSGVAHLPVWHTAVRVLPGGVGGWPEQQAESNIRLNHKKTACASATLTQAAFLFIAYLK